MKKLTGSIAILIFCFWFSSCGGVFERNFTYGVILAGSSDDHGWSEAHYLGGLYVKSQITTSVMLLEENVNTASRPDVTLSQLVSQMVSKGAELIFTTSYDFQASTLEAAEAHPTIKFINISGDYAWKSGNNYKAPSNYSNLMGRMEYGAMIQGCAAALTTKTGKIGRVGSVADSESFRIASSAFLGARYCWAAILNKNAADLKFKDIPINGYIYVPGKTLNPADETNKLIDEDFDVILSGIDTNTVLVETGKRRAAGADVWASPYDFIDACSDSPDACIGVPYFNWGPAYDKAVRIVANRTWTQFWDWNAPDWSNINNPDTSAVGFIKGNGLSADSSTKLDSFIASLAGGLVLFKGPLNYQNGYPFLSNGQTATDYQIWYMPQVLQGME